MTHHLLPVVALVFNAFVWGLSWWPFRQLHGSGVHPLWGTALLYVVALGVLLLARRTAWTAARAYPALWWLALSAGLTNLCFNWAVTVGDVVRVVLLFYLMPAWSVLLAWRLLGERPTAPALLRLALAFAGVVLVVVPADAQWTRLLQGLSLADALALVGGLGFAFTNVTLRRLQAVPGDARMLAMFGGCMVLPGMAALLGTAWGTLPGLPEPAWGWVLVALGLAAAFIVGNQALQYGAARLPAGTTALVMLSEVVFASASAVALGAAAPDLRTALGGACIVGAALLAVAPIRRTPA
ncbi:DMT family transporter [Acidovorax lacteus]|uniref:DMT family transporter n=1 Tax=Acidovorax lacteus TaxID=1924988 RepID=A0ABP8L8F3_9BURK